MTLIHLDDIEAVRTEQRIIDCEGTEIVRQSSTGGELWADIRYVDLFGGREEDE